MDWLLKNTLIGSIAALFFGENWIEEKPTLATAIKVFLYFIFFAGAAGFISSLIF